MTIYQNRNTIAIGFLDELLEELKAHELVECINPEVRKCRLYRLTDKGEEVTKNIYLD